MPAETLVSLTRADVARRGHTLEVLTVAWGATEAVLAIVAAARTGSISLTAFGLDSVIEVISALAVMWRMSAEMDAHRRHRAEHVSLRITGYCLLALAIYVAGASVWGLIHREVSEASWLGIFVTTAAMIFMPLLSCAKRGVARSLHSDAMMTDARQTDFCFYQAVIVLVGLAAERMFGWTWVDAVAGLCLAPIIFRAAILSFQGKSCCAH